MSQLELTDSTKPFTPTIFVDAVLPLPIPQNFTYRVPRELAELVVVGMRIVVPFGKTKIMTAVIREVHQLPPKGYEAKYLIDILDSQPSINSRQFEFFEWLGSYYMCTPGEVLQAALPAGLKISTTSLAQRNPYFSEQEHVLSIEEQLVMQQLSADSPVETAVLSNLVGQKNLSKTLKALISKEAILMIDHIKEKFVPKLRKYIRLSDEIAASEISLEEVVNNLGKKGKQLEVMMAYLRDVPVLEDPEANNDGMSIDNLVDQGCSASSIKTLAEKGILVKFDKEVSRFASVHKTRRDLKLSDRQLKAKTKILESFEANRNVLLHGVTGSGKTEIYIDLIMEMLEAGHQVLYLLPEIALTSQILIRLQAVFGDDIGVYHSKYSSNERVEVWKKVSQGQLNFVVGVRSSLFLPFSDLGLIIIDEEHEPSYKQYDPAPRYHARDAALMLAQFHHAKALLGTATPSMETFYLAREERLGYVQLDRRFGIAKLPEIKAIDIARAKKKKEVQGNFSNELITAIELSLKHEEQVIIFQNRRGYAPFLSCGTCGWVPQCLHCDVSLTYHQYNNELRCHYCGYKTPVPVSCIACGSINLNTVSFGTEQLEEELRLLFPNTEVKRLDLDTTRGKTAYDQIISDFSSGKTRILVGTQMVAKGLDFDNVGLVGIIDLDRMLRFPDFRSVERTFQLSVQVAGRAGRTDDTGKVLIQTYDTGQPVLETIIVQDYISFFESEIEERKLFNYPPFSRIIKLVVKDADHQTASEATLELRKLLEGQLESNMILGPVTPLISRIRDKYLREIYLKIGRKKNMTAIKLVLKDCLTKIRSRKEFKSTTIVIDVDPI